MYVKKIALTVMMFSGLLSQSIHAEDLASLSPNLCDFIAEISQYRLNASWLIEKFMAMNLHEFSAAWTHVVRLMKNPDDRWRYFCDKPEEYNDNLYKTKWIWQCHFFELWLNKVYVYIHDLSLVYDSKGYCQSNPNYAHIFTCWRVLTENGQGDHRAIYDFYAYYADCLAYCLLKGIKIAYVEQDTLLYDKAWHTSFSLSEGLKIMIKQLQTSDYAQRYSAQLDRYVQVLELLKRERVLNMLKN